MSTWNWTELSSLQLTEKSVLYITICIFTVKVIFCERMDHSNSPPTTHIWITESYMSLRRHINKAQNPFPSALWKCRWALLQSSLTLSSVWIQMLLWPLACLSPFFLSSLILTFQVAIQREMWRKELETEVEG